MVEWLEKGIKIPVFWSHLQRHKGDVGEIIIHMWSMMSPAFLPLYDADAAWIAARRRSQAMWRCDFGGRTYAARREVSNILLSLLVFHSRQKVLLSRHSKPGCTFNLACSLTLRVKEIIKIQHQMLNILSVLLASKFHNWDLKPKQFCHASHVTFMHNLGLFCVTSPMESKKQIIHTVVNVLSFIHHQSPPLDYSSLFPTEQCPQQ